LCEGVSRYVHTMDGWSLAMLDWDDFSGPAQLRHFDGFIARLLNPKIASTLSATKKPIVNVFESSGNPDIVQITQDARSIAGLAVHHFLDHRFEHFAFFGHEGIRYSDLRREAFTSCLSEEGFDCLVYPTPPASLGNFEYTVMRREKYSASTERKAIKSWLKHLPKPVAVFCSHDLRAYQLIEQCRELGIRIPSDIAVLGVDNDDLICNFTDPTISSIDPNAEEIGFKAAETLDRLFRGERLGGMISVPPTGIIERKSSAIYPLDPPWISDALVFIHDNAHRRISASDVFRHLDRSHTIVDGTFKRILGTTVSKEIAKARLETAHRLVTSSTAPFAEIAERSGFASIHYFTRSFTAAFGTSPSRLRNGKTRR